MKSELKLFWLDSEVRECPSGFGRRVHAEHLSYKFSLSTAQEKPKGLNCSRLTIKIQHRVCTVGAMQTWKDCYYLDEQFQPGLRPWERELSPAWDTNLSRAAVSSWFLAVLPPSAAHWPHQTGSKSGVSLSWSPGEMSACVLVLGEITREAITEINREQQWK